MTLSDAIVQAEQGQSLDDVIAHFNALYANSPLPFCIRDQSRNMVYRNGAYADFFHPLSGSSDDVELKLSAIEFESFVMGAGTAACRAFVFNGEFYQLRVEIRSIDNELYSFWFINYFPDYQSLFCVPDGSKTVGFDIDVFLAELTTKSLVTLCFSVLGFPPNIISKYLGVSERAIYARRERLRFKISQHFHDFSAFRMHCLKSGIFGKMSAVILLIFKDTERNAL